MMTSRERVQAVLHGRTPDKIPSGFGSTSESGIQPWPYRQLLDRLGHTDAKIFVYEILQMLAMIDPDMLTVLQGDIIGLRLPRSIFGIPTDRYKPYTLYKGLEAFVPELFNTKVVYNGSPNNPGDGVLYQYPGGDTALRPSGAFPEGGGYYCDVTDRSDRATDPFSVSPEEWVYQTYAPLSDEDLRFLEKESERLYNETEFSILGDTVFGGLGGPILIHGPHIPQPKGIRSVEDWYMALLERPDYIKQIHSVQTELGIENLKRYKEAVGDRIDIIRLSGTDFGGQNGLLFSRKLYGELFKPYHEKIIRWVHENTNWKTYFHSCGSVHDLIPDFIDIGLDILNPLQQTATGMDMHTLYREFGGKIMFFGGGASTQSVLAFGSREDVRDIVRRNIELAKQYGGYFFCCDHNIQAQTPVDNIMEMLQVFRDLREL